MLNIGYLGPKGTYSSYASDLYSQNDIKIPFNTINEVLNSLRTSKSDKVIVPLENSINGSIVEVLDFLASKNDFQISSELNLEINHSIYSLNNLDLKNIDIIFSHPQALAQCYDYLSKNFKNAELRASNSTADSFNDLLSSNKNGAFIGPPWMKERKDIRLIDENIQSVKNNLTRFVVIGNKEDIGKTSSDKTSIVISINEDSPGSLFKSLEPLAINNINMTKIESRPTKEKLGSYYFFIDIEGHIYEPKIKECLEEISKVSTLKFLGSYPRFN
tara:strand:+ start:979 stop:1800 length:822 start_codon:yes stop_codon:yes gene_type:complete